MIQLELAGIQHTVSKHELERYLAIGWKLIPGADQGSDAVKVATPPQSSPLTAKRKTK